MTAGSASAAVLDFEAAAVGNEQAYKDGDVVTFGMLDVTLSAGLISNYGAATPVTDDAYAYYDSGGDAGLGVCRNVTTFTNAGNANRCDKVSGAPTSGAGDDNVTVAEFVTLAFDSLQNLGAFRFNNASHNPINSATQTLQIEIYGGMLTEYKFADLGGPMSLFPVFENVSSITFGYDDGQATANQFYLASVTAEEVPNAQVPLPGGLPLMLAGLGGLGIAARRRRT